MRNTLLIFISLSFFSVVLSAASSFHELRGSFEYIYPKPDAELIAKETNIILKPGKILDVNQRYLDDVAFIDGSISGRHSYKALISDDEKTVVLKPDTDFAPGETVIITLSKAINTQNGSLTDTGFFQFKISPKIGKLETEADFRAYFQADEYPLIKDDSKNGTAYIPVLNDDPSLPSDFPDRLITTNDRPDSGYIFMASPRTQNHSPYLMVLDNTGYPVYFKRLLYAAHDFKVQSADMLTYFDLMKNSFYAMDGTYSVIDSFQCGDGYSEYTDFHDIRILDNGHILLFARDPQIIDMSEIVEGGLTNALVYGLIVQELDLMKNVVWQWRSWDHFEITDATWDIDLTAHTIDYVHCNAIELDNDGNILISCRHMDEITKINHDTGDIIWRLGGENNQFTLQGDDRWFSHQHDIRVRPDGNYTLFDNGNLNTPQYSRAVEYELDEQSGIANVIWKYRNNPDIYSAKMGNHQRLPGGNSIISWGRNMPLFTEVRYGGEKAFELTLDPMMSSYRVFRFPWQGNAAKPYLIVEQYDESIHLIFNKFGDSTVVKYYIYTGDTPEPSTVIDSTTENYIDLTDLPKGLTYFRVTAVYQSGQESRFSNEVIMDVDLPTKYLPGDVNMAAGGWPPEAIGADVTYLVNYFRSIPSSSPCLINDFWCSADANGDCNVLGSDVTKLVNYFRGQADLNYCQDYQPAWTTPADLPEEAPDGWPNCE